MTTKYLDDIGTRKLIELLKGAGGGSAGPIYLQVENGDLYAYYDDAIGEPTVFDYEDSEGNLYAIFEVEE